MSPRVQAGVATLDTTRAGAGTLERTRRKPQQGQTGSIRRRRVYSSENLPVAAGQLLQKDRYDKYKKRGRPVDVRISPSLSPEMRQLLAPQHESLNKKSPGRKHFVIELLPCSYSTAAQMISTEEQPEIVCQHAFSPEPIHSAHAEMDHWKQISDRLNAALDARMGWVPESERLARNLPDLDVRREAMRMRLSLPRGVNRRPKVRLYGMTIRVDSSRRGDGGN